MVLVVLAFIWAAALLPPIIRSRMEGNPADSVGRFRRRLRVLESATPVSRLAEGSPSQSEMPQAWAREARRISRLRRRQTIARTLLAVMGSTLVVGLIPGLHQVLIAHVITDLVFVGYIVLLVQARNAAAERRMRAYFETADSQVEDAPRRAISL